MPRLTGTTHVRHPKTRMPVLLRKGDLLPEWAVGRVGAHLLDDTETTPIPDLIEDDTSDVRPPVDEAESDRPDAAATDIGPPPPKSGAGSGRDAWATYADRKGVTVDPEDSRDDIIAALEAADAPADPAT